MITNHDLAMDVAIKNAFPNMSSFMSLAYKEKIWKELVYIYFKIQRCTKKLHSITHIR